MIAEKSSLNKALEVGCEAAASTFASVEKIDGD
jgi:hypothetical protein